MLSTSMEEVHDQYNKASKYYYIYWFVRDYTYCILLFYLCWPHVISWCINRFQRTSQVGMPW